jgi:hypothetical protein
MTRRAALLPIRVLHDEETAAAVLCVDTLKSVELTPRVVFAKSIPAAGTRATLTGVELFVDCPSELMEMQPELRQEKSDVPYFAYCHSPAEDFYQPTHGESEVNQ